ncbi:MAG TPA: nuclear transport factor 2 family protein [Burkholderiaceae bacterium]|nr:nuclear transport factor 2 family protein [Burkholderiaceae bacterium]
MNNPLAAWHRIVQTRDSSALEQLLADDVVFHSPVVHTPQPGKKLTAWYLSAALDVFVNESFRYVREVVGQSDAALEFETVIDGIKINGVDLIKWDAVGQIIEFKVLIRPLQAINAVHHRMAATLQPLRPRA